MHLKSLLAAASLAATACSAPGPAAEHRHDAMAEPPPDARQLVRFPEPMRLHTIASMRDHLLALQEIEEALSRHDFDRAAAVAETRLGMTSLEAHGAAHLAPFMPAGMQELGTGLHHAASRFAVEAQNASVSHDLRAPLAALSDVMRQCVACHAAYRLQ
jgi:cytochrome c556